MTEVAAPPQPAALREAVARPVAAARLGRAGPREAAARLVVVAARVRGARLVAVVARVRAAPRAAADPVASMPARTPKATDHRFAYRLLRPTRALTSKRTAHRSACLSRRRTPGRTEGPPASKVAITEPRGGSGSRLRSGSRSSVGSRPWLRPTCSTWSRQLVRSAWRSRMRPGQTRLARRHQCNTAATPNRSGLSPTRNRACTLRARRRRRGHQRSLE